MTQSETLFQEAVKYIPGGVNSPVRAFGSIGSTPRFITKADKAYMWDEDGNRYIDFIGSWGPMILGHNFPQIREAVVEACADGRTGSMYERLKLWCCNQTGSYHGKIDLRYCSLDRYDPHGQFRHGSCDECHPRCQRIYRPG